MAPDDAKDLDSSEAYDSLKTSRLLIRNFQESDLDELHAMASDPEVTRFTSFGPNSRAETERYLGAAVAEPLSKPREAYSLAVQFEGNGALIGSCGFAKPRHGQYETGYILAQPYWGRGLATELVTALVAFAFRDLAAAKIWAPVDARNDASSRVLEKVGFLQEGLLRCDRMKWPEGRDTKLFGLLAEEWRTTRPAI